MSDDIRQRRTEVAEACRALAASGLVVGTAGNVSARAGEFIAASPMGARLSTLTADEIPVVDLEGAPVDADVAPTSELSLHLDIYRRLGAGAVVHAHPVMATAVACVAEELPCIHYGMLELGGNVRVAPYATFGTADLAAGVLEALEGRTAVLMASHGAVTYGCDVTAAVDAMELLEWASSVYVYARVCGTPQVLAASDRLAVIDALASRAATGGTRRAEAG